MTRSLARPATWHITRSRDLYAASQGSWRTGKALNTEAKASFSAEEG
ncbi:hypothetical protein [Synechococcus sp. KORDI-52]|nr:hypothetical protein [Synechococcus sp. KORDI-52]